MLKPEQIPKVSAKAVCELFEPGYLESIGLHPESIIAAALSAWPGMDMQQTDWERWKLPFPLIILPLPQEASDE